MSKETREYAKQLVSQMTLEEKMSQMVYQSPAIERLGIPAYNWWNGPILDEKYDLHKHVNVKYTEDGGAPPYDYAKAPLSHEDVTIDTRRLDDYELLSAGEILGREQSF